MDGKTNNTKRRYKNSEPHLVIQADENGKLPPQAVDLEEAVLGAMLLEREALSTVIDILSKEAFYKEQNGCVFAAMASLFNRSEPVDILTVTQELKRTGELELVGGAYYVSALTNRIASAANIEFHARIVSQKHLQRELIRINTVSIKEAYQDVTDVFELLDKTTENIFSLLQGNTKKKHKKISTLLATAIEEMEEAGKKDGYLGVPSGFISLDRLTGGWQRSDLITLAARPGMGKSAFAALLAKNAAVEFNKPVAIFSLEMSAVQLAKRLISTETEILQDKILKGNLSDYEYTQMNERLRNLSSAPLFIDDTQSLSLFELRAKARRLKNNEGIQLIIIDYLQLMSGGQEGRGNREQEISTISRGLKGLAKELDIPIIALSQLSRQVENRPGNNNRPKLSDLRESGAIEQDADMVMFIYRPDYYGMLVDESGNILKGNAEIIIEKNRHGPTSQVFLKWVSQFMKFTEFSEESYEEKVSSIVKLENNNNFLDPENPF